MIKQRGMMLLSLFTISLLSCASYAKKMTMEDAYAADKAYSDAVDAATANATPERLQEDWAKYVDPSSTRPVDWDKMPAGTRCGTYVMSGGRVTSLTQCQGHNPRYSCPTGFSREDFGYFEAGGGERHYNWCV